MGCDHFGPFQQYTKCIHRTPMWNRVNRHITVFCQNFVDNLELLLSDSVMSYGIKEKHKWPHLSILIPQNFQQDTAGACPIFIVCEDNNLLEFFKGYTVYCPQTLHTTSLLWQSRVSNHFKLRLSHEQCTSTIGRAYTHTQPGLHDKSRCNDNARQLSAHQWWRSRN